MVLRLKPNPPFPNGSRWGLGRNNAPSSLVAVVVVLMVLLLLLLMMMVVVVVVVVVVVRVMVMHTPQNHWTLYAETTF